MVLIVVKSTKNVKVDLKKLKNELQLWARTNLIIGVNKFKMATKLGAAKFKMATKLGAAKF